MELYQKEDITLLLDKWPSIMEEVDNEKLKLFEPTLDEMKKVQNTIIDFIKENKRKVYGGFALNMLISDKNPNDGFYKSEKAPADVDFYSPEPITDLIKLCNILHEKGYKYVLGREAQHEETYSIRVNLALYCDITYVPRNIYNKMPFKELNGLHLIGPHFMTIDYLRMMTDPMISYWRFDGNLKGFRRYYLLQKYYPLPHNNKSLSLQKNPPTISSALNTIFKFLQNKKTMLVCGFYAYNYFLHESGILNEKSKIFKHVDIPYFDIISTNYRDDCLELIQSLKDNKEINKDDVNYTEYYPFFQFTGHSVEIKLKNEILVKIFTNNKKCIPYIDVPTLQFFDTEKPKKINNSFVRICTFPVVTLQLLIGVIKFRTNGDEDMKQLYYTMISHLIEMRNYYLTTNNKTFLDDSVFKEFIVNCAGDTMTPDRQRILAQEGKKKKIIFQYRPEDKLREPESTYKFANSSGNPISYEKNLRLSNFFYDETDEDAEADITDSSDSVDKSKKTSRSKKESKKESKKGSKKGSKKESKKGSSQKTSDYTDITSDE